MDIDEFLDREAALLEEEAIEETFLKEELHEYEEILDKINSCIKKNELEQAEKLYSQLWLKITEDKFTWQQDLYEALIQLNKKIKNSLNILQQDTAKKIKIMDDLISKAKSNIAQGDHKSALTIYSEIIDTYNEIPNLFLAEKKRIYLDRILPLHEYLRDNIEKAFFHSFNSNLSEINNLISLAKRELQKNNIEEASKHYANCLNLYNSLPDGFFLKKIELSNELLEIYREISVNLGISDLKSRLELKKETFKLPYTEPYTEKNPPIHPKIPIFERPSLPKEKVYKSETLKEELVKRKIDRALLKLGKGRIEEANKDLKDALRIDPINQKAKSLLEKNQLMPKKLPEEAFRTIKELQSPTIKPIIPRPFRPLPIKILEKPAIKENFSPTSTLAKRLESSKTKKHSVAGLKKELIKRKGLAHPKL